MKNVLVIVNPASGGGRTGRSWPAVAARLRAAGLDFDTAMTSCLCEAIELSRQAVAEGRPLIVAAGGDGTINEVANGFFARGGEPAAGPRLGVLPTGTGGDLRRTLGFPQDVGEAAAVLLAGRTRRIDAGRVTCTRPDGETTVRYFVNIADAGIGGDVVHQVNSGRRVINGEVTFMLASLSMQSLNSITVNLPQGDAPNLQHKEPVTLTITKDSHIFLDKTPVTLENMAFALKPRCRTVRSRE